MNDPSLEEVRIQMLEKANAADQLHLEAAAAHKRVLSGEPGADAELRRATEAHQRAREEYNEAARRWEDGLMGGLR